MLLVLPGRYRKYTHEKSTFAAFHSVSKINGNVVPLPMDGVMNFSCDMYCIKKYAFLTLLSLFKALYFKNRAVALLNGGLHSAWTMAYQSTCY
jgi:hypothetical protein